MLYSGLVEGVHCTLLVPNPGRGRNLRQDDVLCRCLVTIRDTCLDQSVNSQLTSLVGGIAGLDRSLAEGGGCLGHIPAEAVNACCTGIICRDRSAFADCQLTLADGVLLLYQCNGCTRKRSCAVLLHLIDSEGTAVEELKARCQSAAQADLCAQHFAVVGYRVICYILDLELGQICNFQGCYRISAINGIEGHLDLANAGKRCSSGGGSIEIEIAFKSQRHGFAAAIQCPGVTDPVVCYGNIRIISCNSLGDLTFVIDGYRKARTADRIAAVGRYNLRAVVCNDLGRGTVNCSECELSKLFFVSDLCAVLVHIRPAVFLIQICYILKGILVACGILVGVLTQCIRGVSLGVSRIAGIGGIRIYIDGNGLVILVFENLDVVHRVLILLVTVRCADLLDRVAAGLDSHAVRILAGGCDCSRRGIRNNTLADRIQAKHRTSQILVAGVILAQVDGVGLLGYHIFQLRECIVPLTLIHQITCCADPSGSRAGNINH